MNGSIRQGTEYEGKQEEDLHPEPYIPAYSHGDVEMDDAASDEPDFDAHEPGNGAREGVNVLKLPLRGDDIRTLVGLELPFYSTNTERVMETVGGLQTMQQTHESKSQFLPVKLRPTEPSCKPLFADLTKTQTILLRVWRKKKTHNVNTNTNTNNAPTSSSTSDSKKPPTKFRFHGEIVGVVREKYVCEGMADFQYFTAKRFHADATESTTRPPPTPTISLDTPTVGDNSTLPVGSFVPPTALSTYPGSSSQLAIKQSLRPYLRVQEESELEMIPEVFSKVDLPLKYEFRQRSGYQPTESAKKTSATMTYLNFHDDTPAPAAPKPDNPVIRRRPVGSHENVDDDVLKILQEKLAQKPIWLRPKLFVGLDFMERRAARRILRKLCYVFVDGPWRGSWIRMGYDPRKSAESAKYQVIELRNNRELVHAKVTHPNRKRTKKYSGINPKGPRIAKVTQTSEHANTQDNKRRRKERFLRGETRRSYLVDPNEQQQQPPPVPGSPDPSVVSNASASTVDKFMVMDSDSEQEEFDGMDEDGKQTDEDQRSVATSVDSSGARRERTYEIFGVPLTSANVLFQLDEIDDEEVAAWIAQFKPVDKPTLLGGWYSTHMFLPLREIIRYRIAALVGRSKGELETRRKRIEALKKQALRDYKDQLAGHEPGSGKKSNDMGHEGEAGQDGGAGPAEKEETKESEPVDIIEDEASALEAALAASHAAEMSSLPKDGANLASAEQDNNDDEEDEDEEEAYGSQDEDAADAAAHGRLQDTTRRREDEDEDEEDDDDEEDDEDDEDEEDQAAQNKRATEVSAEKTSVPPTPVDYSF